MVDYAQTPSVPADRALELGVYLRRMDWLLMLAVGVLVGVGIWAIGGITRDDVAGDPDYYVVRQSVFDAK